MPVLVCAQTTPGYVGGEVMFVSGKAERVQKDGQSNAVAKGMTLLEGDRIKTDANSHVYVRLRDGGLLVVRPASDLHVDLWRYDPARPQDTQVKYTLENGVARQVDGAGVKAARDKFRFNTPMAAIGVRGTDFTVLADATVTRVSVQSGGVIVNGFGNGCRVEGLGPCEGSSAVELFANASNKLLQVRAGERRPEVIDDPAAAPDRNHPPASGEPVAQHPIGSPDVRIADSRGTDVVQQLDHDVPSTPTPPPPDPPIAVWGRWAAITANDPGTIKADDVLNGRTRVAINSFYVLAANPEMTSFALPGDGVANFTLAAHDGVITDTASGTSVASTASNGKLSIDFGAKRFSTSLDVAAGALATQVSAQGSVDSTGKFQSDLFVSPSIVSGIVGGKGASEAMYLYQRSFNDHYTATGATSWHK
ncbi:MAG TPA: FecR family protein [Ramlibacter sp.]